MLRRTRRRGEVGPGVDDERDRRRSAVAEATCPICDLAAANESKIYVHLQTGHRKSALSRALLDDGAENSSG